MTGWLALLALGGLAMWTAVPAAWLWIGSHAGGGVVAVLGAVATMAVVAGLLGSVNRRHQAARVRRGLEDTGSFPLEVTLVCSAFAAAGALLLLWIGFEIRPGR